MPALSTCWNEKFSCKRQILLRLCKAFHNLSKINDDCPTKIADFVALFNQHLCALRNLSEPIAFWNSILVTIITSKMSPNIWNWELTLKDNDMLPYLDLLNFLEKRANCVPATTRRTSPRRRDKQEDKFSSQIRNVRSGRGDIKSDVVSTSDLNQSSSDWRAWRRQRSVPIVYKRDTHYKTANQVRAGYATNGTIRFFTNHQRKVGSTRRFTPENQ